MPGLCNHLWVQNFCMGRNPSGLWLARAPRGASPSPKACPPASLGMHGCVAANRAASSALQCSDISGNIQTYSAEQYADVIVPVSFADVEVSSSSSLPSRQPRRKRHNTDCLAHSIDLNDFTFARPGRGRPVGPGFAPVVTASVLQHANASAGERRHSAVTRHRASLRTGCRNIAW
jgi:hypothetical protein